MSRTAFVRLEWALAAALVVVAAAWARVRGIPLGERCEPSLWLVALGVAAGALLWLSIPLLQRSASMRRVWTGVLAPFSRQLAPRDVVVIALLSGTSEELFFRGILLPELGVVASSVVFGLLHALTGWYAAWAACTGAIFALLVRATDSLVPAMVAHATYNLGALMVLRSWPADEPARPGPLT